MSDLYWRRCRDSLCSKTIMRNFQKRRDFGTKQTLVSRFGIGLRQSAPLLNLTKIKNGNNFLGLKQIINP